MQSFFLHTGISGLCKLFHDKKIKIAAISYLFICAFILYKYGINTNGEALKYIDDANRILKAENLRDGFFSTFYIVYSLIISFFIYFSFDLQGVAWVQILFSFIAACSIYKLLIDVTKEAKISFAAFIVYLMCYPIQKWIFFLYTESLHTSFTVIGLYFMYCIIQKKQIQKWGVFAFILLLIIFSRPVGVIFLITFFTVSAIWLIKNKRRIYSYFFFIILIAICILSLQSKFSFYFNPDSLRRMEIICQKPQPNTALGYKEYNSSGLLSYFHVITYEIGVKNFVILGIKKLGNFFGMARVFYSSIHNSVLIFSGIILYPLALTGLILFKNDKTFYIKAFSFIYILITSIGIFFTCDEWSNRFMSPVLPHIIILFGFGLYTIKLRWFTR